MSWRIIQGDCVEWMAELDEASMDAVVCDPPYELGFMGRAWDRSDIAYQKTTWQAALRVLKPGGHLLAFGGTRTYHRLACAIEDAGFEIRDTICWLYGSGFPKSLDVSKAIDKAAGVDTMADERWRHEPNPLGGSEAAGGGAPANTFGQATRHDGKRHLYESATPEAQQWQGWGTALKPAHEPIVVARKPLAGTVAQNVLAHGTGALNVDGTRIDAPGGLTNGGNHSGRGPLYMSADGDAKPERSPEHGFGRWPANAVFDEEAARLLDEQTGELVSGWSDSDRPDDPVSPTGNFGAGLVTGQHYGDSGGASRFFYVAKASRAERNAGLEGFEEHQAAPYNERPSGQLNAHLHGADPPARQNVHPTVKPISLMRWLVRLVTPPDGTVLDPFAGSGTTGCAAALEGFDFIGIEREAEYVKMAEARIAWWDKHRGDGEAAEILRAGEERDAVEATGQLGLEL